MSNIAMQIKLQAAGMILSGANVLFDTIQYASGNIDYDTSSGVITLNETGRYVINWWAATQSSSSAVGPVFALSSSQGDFIEGNSPIKTGEVYGVGIIDVSSAPVTLSLVNSSTGSFYYAVQVPLKATLVILQDNVVTETMSCFAVAQLTNILSQMITAYPTTTWSVYSQSMASYSGEPLDLYTSPNATGPGFLRLADVNTGYEALSIDHITVVYPGEGTAYSSSFTYLSPPAPLPASCDTDMIAAVQSYLPLGANVEIHLGTIAVSGNIYRNEYGVLVLAESDGNTPIFIATPHILRIFTADDPTLLLAPKSDSQKPGVSLLQIIDK